MNIQNYIENIFKLKNESEFNHLALQLFNYQYKKNITYKKYVNLIYPKKLELQHYTEIPFLPIDFFKTQKILSIKKDHKTFFLSSGTTANNKSKHYIIDLDIYRKSIISSFQLFFGDITKFVFLCLVPSFEEEPNSSLSFMCNELIKESKSTESGFFMNDKCELKETIINCQKNKQNFILFGLSLEILNFAHNNISLKGGIIIETGGTKKGETRIIKEALHAKLKSLFNVENIYSEYGMAELLSQSYLLNNTFFQSPPWKKILIRDKTNPLKIINTDQKGCINIIDLAIICSCGFIATNDIGSKINNGFNVIGRTQNATVRGCDLMV